MSTVFKVGGSLLLRPDLGTRIQRIVAGTSKPLLVVGGGTLTDVVRDWDRVHGLGAKVAHELAIGSTRLTASLVLQIVASTVLCDSRESAREAWNSGEIPVLDVPAFLAAEDVALAKGGSGPSPAANSLPASWETTSDSIAAWVAHRWPADELVLVKSRAPSGSNTNGANTTGEPDWSRAAEEGLVDSMLPELAVGIPIVRLIDASQSI